MTSETFNDVWNVPDVRIKNHGSNEALVHIAGSPSNNYQSCCPLSTTGVQISTSPTSTNSSSLVISQTVVDIAGPYKYLSINEEVNGDGRPLSRTNLQAHSYESHIDITDTDAITTVSLHRCQDLVVSRYNTLLKLIGWRPFGREYSFRHPRLWKALNCIYTFVVILLLCYSYVYSAIFCESQLHLRGLAVGKAAKLRIINLTTTSSPPTTDPLDNDYPFPFWDTLRSTQAPKSNNMTSRLKDEEDCTADYLTIRECHLLTTCIIPSIIHGLIYLYGFYHFRIKENEHLDALMEKVFLQAQTTFGCQERLIRNTRRFIWLAAVWVLFVMALFALGLFAYGLPLSTINNHCSLPKWVSILLVALDGVAELLTACVCAAVIVNYASQCEFLLNSIRHICLQLHERQFYLKHAMHEILGIRDQLSQLNGALAKITSLCVLNFSVMFVIGFGLLIMNTNLSAEQWICRVIFLVCWFSILLVPVVQAARMTKMGEKLRQISFEIRVFGYKNCSQLDLDSFILFVSNATLRTKLFSVPVKSAYLVSCAAIITFTLLLLFQTDTIQTSVPEIF